MNAIFVIHKPAGMTSSNVVQHVRRAAGLRRVGHGGTLDPQATGVLPVCTGQAARLFDYFEDAGKEYVAHITFGYTSDTQDIWGQLESVQPDVEITQPMLQAVLERFIGHIEQIPPMYSAIKQNGKKLYELARAGQEVERPARPVVIHSIKIEGQLDKNCFVLRVACSKGTYIRTLCHDIGQALGCGAVMSALQRTRSGTFEQCDAVTLEDIAQASEQGTLAQLAYPVEKALAHYPAVHVESRWEKPLCNGVAVPVEAPQGICRVYLDGQLLGLGLKQDTMLKMKLQLQGGAL